MDSLWAIQHAIEKKHPLLICGKDSSGQHPAIFQAVQKVHVADPRRQFQIVERDLNEITPKELLHVLTARSLKREEFVLILVGVAGKTFQDQEKRESIEAFRPKKKKKKKACGSDSEDDNKESSQEETIRSMILERIPSLSKCIFLLLDNTKYSPWNKRCEVAFKQHTVTWVGWSTQEKLRWVRKVLPDFQDTKGQLSQLQTLSELQVFIDQLRVLPDMPLFPQIDRPFNDSLFRVLFYLRSQVNVASWEYVQQATHCFSWNSVSKQLLHNAPLLLCNPRGQVLPRLSSTKTTPSNTTPLPNAIDLYAEWADTWSEMDGLTHEVQEMGVPDDGGQRFTFFENQYGPVFVLENAYRLRNVRFTNQEAKEITLTPKNKSTVSRDLMSQVEALGGVAYACDTGRSWMEAMMYLETRLLVHLKGRWFDPLQEKDVSLFFHPTLSSLEDLPVRSGFLILPSDLQWALLESLQHYFQHWFLRYEDIKKITKKS